MFCLVLIVVIFSSLFQIETAENYCSPDLCAKDVTHIACNNHEKFSPDCSIDAKLLNTDNDIINMILQKHNELRNKVAQGGFNGFTPATRMATMTWDKELAYLASLAVRACSTKHDNCHNTKRFPKSGQNTVYKAYTGEIPTTPDIINAQINMWFDQSKDMTMESIISFTRPEPEKPTANFAQFVQEAANKIGCAILVQNKNDWYQQFLTCNYAAINILGRPVYKSGAKAASACQTGVNQNYPNLCSNLESYIDEYTNSDSASSGGGGTIAHPPAPDRRSTEGDGNDEKANENENENHNENQNENQNTRSIAFENFLNRVAQHIEKFKFLNISVKTSGQEQIKVDRIRVSRQNKPPTVRRKPVKKARNETKNFKKA